MTAGGVGDESELELRMGSDVTGSEGTDYEKVQITSTATTEGGATAVQYDTLSLSTATGEVCEAGTILEVALYLSISSDDDSGTAHMEHTTVYLTFG